MVLFTSGEVSVSCDNNGNTTLKTRHMVEMKAKLRTHIEKFYTLEDLKWNKV